MPLVCNAAPGLPLACSVSGMVPVYVDGSTTATSEPPKPPEELDELEEDELEELEELLTPDELDEELEDEEDEDELDGLPSPDDDSSLPHADSRATELANSVVATIL